MSGRRLPGAPHRVLAWQRLLVLRIVGTAPYACAACHTGGLSFRSKSFIQSLLRLPAALPPAFSAAAEAGSAWALGLLEILRRQSRAKAGVDGLGEDCHSLFFRLGAKLAVGRAAPRCMDHGLVAFAAKLGQQPPQMPFAEARLLGGLLLRNEFFVCFCAAPPAGRALVVSSVVVLGCSPLQGDLVNRTFLLGTFRTLSLGSDRSTGLQLVVDTSTQGEYNSGYAYLYIGRCVLADNNQPQLCRFRGQRFKNKTLPLHEHPGRRSENRPRRGRRHYGL